MSQRFTIDGGERLEAHLAATCKIVLSGVQSIVPATKLAGVLLGGGYGRGEGGVLQTASGDQPYNDLEFYVFVDGSAVLAEKQYRHPLHRLGEYLSPAAGLEVEFKVLTLHKLRRSAPSMFYYDLVAGHRWLLGDDTLLAGCEHHHEAAEIPLHEATRLLMNRCSGLLYSAGRLARKDLGEAEADFVGRNLAKARLAFGDVLLAANAQYHWSCRTRHARLLNLSGLKQLPMANLIQHHAHGVEFKLHPTRSAESRPVLTARHTELSALGKQLWLWLEAKRLGVKFPSARDYAFTPLNLCPETSALRNRLVNVRAFGALGLISASYPRENLLRTLPLLLWERDEFEKVRSELRTHTRDFSGLVLAYEQLWKRFN